MNTNTNIESNKREKHVENITPIKKGPIMNPIFGSFDNVLQQKMSGNNSYSFSREIDG